MTSLQGISFDEIVELCELTEEQEWALRIDLARMRERWAEMWGAK